MPSDQRNLFQIDEHLPRSLVFLSIMDSAADIDLNKTRLSSSKSISSSDDYENDLRLAAEFGRCLLERNQELQTYITHLQKQIDEKQSDVKLLHAKFLSTREQLDAKCKQTDVLDAANYDLEQELTQQRRDNEKNRQHIRELFDLCEKTRKQCYDIEQEYETFRAKQFSSCFLSKPSTFSSQQSLSHRRQRAQSFNRKSIADAPTPFDSPLSSTLLYKAHLGELKSRIHSLTSECGTLTDQLHRSEQEKHYLIERITQLERQRRDDNDSLQNELNDHRKLLEKFSHEQQRSKSIPLHMYSSPEYDTSLYDEVQFENQPWRSSSYEPTNFQALFAPVYEKLRVMIQ